MALICHSFAERTIRSTFQAGSNPLGSFLIASWYCAAPQLQYEAQLYRPVIGRLVNSVFLGTESKDDSLRRAKRAVDFLST